MNDEEVGKAPPTNAGGTHNVRGRTAKWNSKMPYDMRTTAPTTKIAQHLMALSLEGS
jgi:hypothetical protein